MFANTWNPEFYSSTSWYCLPPGTYKVLNDGWIDSETFTPGIQVDKCMNM